MSPEKDSFTKQLQALSQRLGLKGDLGLLKLAVSHRSWCAEHIGQESNERLEFLGDSVLGLIVTEYIYLSFPSLAEGELAKLRSSVVDAATLAQIASSLDLGSALLLGKGENSSGGRQKVSILADAMEAVIGSIYLSEGFPTVRELVLNLLSPYIQAGAQGPGERDYKTRLQELSAHLFDASPKYDLQDKGPDHAKIFFAVVTIQDRQVGTGQGRSKKQAEQAAAKMAWQELISSNSA